MKSKVGAIVGAACALGVLGMGVTATAPAAERQTAAPMFAEGDGFPEGCTNTSGGSGSPNTGTHVGGNGTSDTGGGVGVEAPESNGPGGSASDEDSRGAGGTGCPPSAPGALGADETP